MADSALTRSTPTLQAAVCSSPAAAQRPHLLPRLLLGLALLQRLGLQLGERLLRPLLALLAALLLPLPLLLPLLPLSWLLLPLPGLLLALLFLPLCLLARPRAARLALVLLPRVRGLLLLPVLALLRLLLLALLLLAARLPAAQPLLAVAGAQLLAAGPRLLVLLRQLLLPALLARLLLLPLLAAGWEGVGVGVLLRGGGRARRSGAGPGERVVRAAGAARGSGPRGGAHLDVVGDLRLQLRGALRLQLALEPVVLGPAAQLLHPLPLQHGALVVLGEARLGHLVQAQARAHPLLVHLV
jgi:hypothetical protein